jgi:hypothetical protein
MTHVVVRQFNGPAGTVFQSGQQVNASEWRNLPNLVRARYLRPKTVVEAAQETAAAKPTRGQKG